MYTESYVTQIDGRIGQKGLAFVPNWKDSRPAPVLVNGFIRTSVVVEFPDGDTLLINETHRRD